MNQDQLDAFGKEDPAAQLTWLLQRDKELRKLWKCSCGEPLPTKGDIWKERWENFRLAHRVTGDPEDIGWYCHVCVERENGKDW